jgi:V/A-type H+-transporting ATPase subunit I
LTGILIISVVFKKQDNPLSLYLIYVSVFLLISAFLFLMLIKAKEQKGIVMKLFWAFYGAYNVIAGNLLGDILSYSRLFGLGLTTAVLGLVVNEMAFMSKGIPYAGYIIAVILLIVGHIGNLAINLLGSYVHTSRLQYLEFFTKFFESGGRQFRPFSPIRKYTYISKDSD